MGPYSSAGDRGGSLTRRCPACSSEAVAKGLAHPIEAAREPQLGGKGTRSACWSPFLEYGSAEEQRNLVSAGL